MPMLLGQEKILRIFQQKMMRVGGFLFYFYFLGRGPTLTTPIYSWPRAESQSEKDKEFVKS